MSKEYERYYKYSMLYDLAYHDDVNGNCDGKIDITVVDCISGADVEPVRHGYWTGIEGDVCSECGASLTEIMDADSYFAIGFNPNDLVACPFCGARMDGGNK